MNIAWNSQRLNNVIKTVILLSTQLFDKQTVNYLLT